MNQAQVPVFGTGGNRAQVPLFRTGGNGAQIPVFETEGNQAQAPFFNTGGNQRPDDRDEAVLCWTNHGDFQCIAWSTTTDKRYTFTRSNIQEPLLRLQNPRPRKLALDCFDCIMKFMGDCPMEGNQTEYDCVLRLLKICNHDYPELRDEIYCQLCKQTTNNRSANPMSCIMGWRLFSIVSCYCDCSYKLWPHLKAYIETNASDTSSAFSKTASLCLHHLKKTKKYGGRKKFPLKEEIHALSVGMLTQRYTFIFSESKRQGTIQVGPSLVVRDAVEEICYYLDILDEVEIEEYALFLHTNLDTTPQLKICLKQDEYILDITTELDRKNEEYNLVFQRTLWLFPFRETDNSLYNEVMFSQCLPDYTDGMLFTLLNGRMTRQEEEDVAFLGALLYKVFDREGKPTMQDLTSLLPFVVRLMPDYKPSSWLHKIQHHMSTANRLGPLNCKAKFVAVLSRWPLFGSTFFAVKDVMSAGYASRILTVNKNGIHLLHDGTHEIIFQYQHSEVLSTRGSKSNNQNYLDVKVGSLMVQKIIRFETDQGSDISHLIGQYQQLIDHHR